MSNSEDSVDSHYALYALMRIRMDIGHIIYMTDGRIFDLIAPIAPAPTLPAHWNYTDLELPQGFAWHLPKPDLMIGPGYRPLIDGEIMGEYEFWDSRQWLDGHRQGTICGEYNRATTMRTRDLVVRFPVGRSITLQPKVTKTYKVRIVRSESTGAAAWMLRLHTLEAGAEPASLTEYERILGDAPVVLNQPYTLSQAQAIVRNLLTHNTEAEVVEVVEGSSRKPWTLKPVDIPKEVVVPDEEEI